MWRKRRKDAHAVLAETKEDTGAEDLVPVEGGAPPPTAAVPRAEGGTVPAHPVDADPRLAVPGEEEEEQGEANEGARVGEVNREKRIFDEEAL